MTESCQRPCPVGFDRSSTVLKQEFVIQQRDKTKINSNDNNSNDGEDDNDDDIFEREEQLREL